MARELKAIVVGGGIADLTSAASLVQAGWQTTVLERAPAFGEIGAGLAITRNGMAALEAIGLDEAVRSVGYETLTAGFQDPSGRWLFRIPDNRADVRWTTTIWGVHRQRLHAAPRVAAEGAGGAGRVGRAGGAEPGGAARAGGAQSEGAELVTGAKVTSVRPGAAGGEPATVTWRTDAGERTSDSDLVVAADGVRSTVRAQLFAAARPRYSGRASWRAVIPYVGAYDGLVELWGPGAEFGALRVSRTELYWFGYFRHPEGQSFDDELAAARSHFSGWSPQVRATLEATQPSQLMRHDVYHLPGGLPTYIRGRVVLVGDAAHAALPTMGQEAASSLEDGVRRMIAEPVTAGGDLTSALAAFDQARGPRCRRIARQSATIARFGPDLGGGWRQSLRNRLLRVVPAGAVVTAGAQLVRWTPPAGGAPRPTAPRRGGGRTDLVIQLMTFQLRPGWRTSSASGHRGGRMAPLRPLLPTPAPEQARPQVSNLDPQVDAPLLALAQVAAGSGFEAAEAGVDHPDGPVSDLPAEQRAVEIPQ
ncbi:MAG: FAD-dependent oxidoreductase [Acidimicrobiales bacterium]